jgi:hypothetical protein
MAELSDEAKAEIKAAFDILKSDHVHFNKWAAKHLAKGETPPADPKTPPADPKPPVKTEGEPPPPRPADPPADPAPKKAGMWWGTKE